MNNEYSECRQIAADHLTDIIAMARSIKKDARRKGQTPDLIRQDLRCLGRRVQTAIDAIGKEVR